MLCEFLIPLRHRMNEVLDRTQHSVGEQETPTSNRDNTQIHRGQTCVGGLGKSPISSLPECLPHGRDHARAMMRSPK